MTDPEPPRPTQFLGIRVPAWTDALDSAATAADLDGLRVVPRASHHLTLAHLGRPTVEVRNEVMQALEVALNDFMGCTLTPAAVGRFRQSVLWVGVEAQPAGALRLLANTCRDVVTDVTGRCPSKEFSAHVTIALRQRGAPVETEHAASLAAAWAAVEQVEPIRVDVVSLLRTDRTLPHWYVEDARLPLAV